MKSLLFYIILILFTINGITQTNYTNGNQAYWTERSLGFNDVIIGGGNIIYTYDTTNHLYRNGDKILLPNLTTLSNGDYVVDSTFYGYGIGGNANNMNYQWDAQTIIAQNNEFDASHLFVSPVSTTPMSYAKALQFNNTFCNYGDCSAIVDGPVESLAYPNYLPQCDTFQLWIGEDLIDAGDLKGTGTIAKISQQQLDTTSNRSYCVNTYGQGWRLPTDIEAGHTNDMEGFGHGFHDGYKGNTQDYMWTSSLFKTYNVKRWPVELDNGYWENCAGFLYTNNYVRCVFHSSAPNSNMQASISGNVVYDNLSATPLDSVCLILKDQYGNILDSTISDTSGYYIFNGLNSGLYHIEVVCSKTPGGFNSSDALAIMKHFVALITLKGLNLEAAEVDGNGYINSIDALATARRFVGLINSFPSGDWVFDIDTITVNGSPVYRKIRGLSFGDVNASFQPAKGKFTLPWKPKALIINSNRQYKLIAK